MTRKRLLPLLLLMAFSLAACRGATGEGEVVTAPTNTAQALLPPTWTPAPTQAPGCTVVSTDAASTREIEELLGPVTEDDWIRGSYDARVTIIEYSDFQ
jgi:predicted small secreted protein